MPEFLIADTFTDSLARLGGEEQKAVKMAAFDLQLDPTRPGMSFHKLDRVRDKNFWSVRVDRDIRLIVHRSNTSLLLCYVDHHDKAYEWAERRKLETHPRTGAAQFVEIRETVQEVFRPIYVENEVVEQRTPLFAELTDDALLEFGVPEEWLDDVKSADEDALLALTDHLPAEAAEALLELATGGKPRVPESAAAAHAPFEHPDAQRRFRIMTNVEELERALAFPWEKWTVFLHPEQRRLVERDYSGPARVSGSAGTGKTIVALHRAVHLARTNPDARVLLTTFSEALANSLRTKLKRLLSNEPRLAERIDVHSLDSIGLRLYRSHLGAPRIAASDVVQKLLSEAAAHQATKFGPRFLRAEWDEVVDAWQLRTWEAYRDVARLGRKTRLPAAQREVLWWIFEDVQTALAGEGLITMPELFTSLAGAVKSSRRTIFDVIVVDESQDLSPSHLRLFAALGRGRQNSLFFAGDLGQRIFQQPFSWKSLGVEVRGRSRTMRVNYRMSHQIRTRADRLLGPVVTDVDGNVEDRSDTVSVFNGPPPSVQTLGSAGEEIESVAAWMKEKTASGILPHEFGVFVRSADQLPRAQASVTSSGMRFVVLDKLVDPVSGSVAVSTMHLAKGLEFRAVAVMACDDEVIPLQERIESVGDDADLKEVYETERHLLYVACTRARDHLLVTGVEPASEFLDDMR